MPEQQLLRVPGGPVTVTNLDKPLFPSGFTKGQMIAYYVEVAPFILPHLKNRPVTLKRYPDGVGARAFYEKNAPAYTPEWVRTTPVWRRNRASQIHYIVVSNVRTLAWCAQIATIELHPFLHRAGTTLRPRCMVFDLDPGEGADILACIDVAFWVRDALEDQKLVSFVKVSGSKGLQLYVPLNTPASYEATQGCARALARRLERRHPDRIVSDMAKARRHRKVLIDWSQNADFKTTVSVYSMRAKRDRPFISMPVTWEELRRARRRRKPASLFWEPVAALDRLGEVGDLFAPVLTLKQRLRLTASSRGILNASSHHLPVRDLHRRRLHGGEAARRLR